MIGRTISHYRIEAELGRGGMGVVYRAADLNLNRPVAIKFLSSEVATEDRRRRFQQEAQTASSLNHPHILTVFEAGTIDGEQYLVTEFIDGCTLREWAHREARSIRQIVELAVTIADALACAHQAGILHRDIKPENILISKDGYAKVVDFGLAKLVEPVSGPTSATRTIDAAVETRAGVVVGTIPYMSPEQLSGKQVDARSDIFSFGVVLYELLAGHRPFGGESDPQLIHEIRHTPPRPLLEMRADTPFSLVMAVDKALEKEPAERYQSMREMVVDLKRVQRLQSSDAARALVTPQPLAEPQRNRWGVGIAIVVIALGLGATAGWFANSRSAVAVNPLANAQFTRFTDFPGAEHDAAISPDGKFVAFRSDRDGPFDVWLSQVGSGQFVNLTKGQDDELRTPTRSMGFSGDGSEIWLGGAAFNVRRLRLMPLMGGTPRVFLREGAVVVAWSPDGTRLAFHTGYAGDPLFVADNTGADAKQIYVNPNPGGHTHFPTWSQDGRWIYFVTGFAFTNEMDLWRIRPNGGAPEQLTHQNNDVRHPTPIGPQTLLYTSPADDGSGPWLWTIDLNSKVSRRVSFGLEKYTSVAASADGRRLVASVSNPTATLWSVPILDRPAGEQDVKLFPLTTVRALAPRYGSASLFYLSSLGTGDGLWRYHDGQSFEIWKGSNGVQSTPPAVSPDGRRVTVVLRRSGKLRLHVMSADGTDLQPLAEAIDVQGSACWSPDGKWIVTGGNDGKGPGLFKIPVEGAAPLRITTGPSLNPVWSPDGDVIVYAGTSVALYVPLHAVRPDGASVELPHIQVRGDGEHVRFLPHGKALVYMQGVLASQDFWLLDLATKKTRPLTHLSNNAAMRTFDITPDGKQIVFDRMRENSDIVLIDLKH